MGNSASSASSSLPNIDDFLDPAAKLPTLNLSVPAQRSWDSEKEHAAAIFAFIHHLHDLEMNGVVYFVMGPVEEESSDRLRVDLALNNMPVVDMSLVGPEWQHLQNYPAVVSTLHELHEQHKTEEATLQLSVPFQVAVSPDVAKFFASHDKFGFTRVRITSDPGSDPTAIGDGFLRSCHSVAHLDLAELEAVVTIGDDFLRDCHSLVSVDFSGFGSVTQIGNNSLKDCRALTGINLAPFENVTIIGADFLGDCSSLQSADLSGFRNLKQIGSNFMKYCLKLTEVQLGGLNQVSHIPSGFFGFSGLISVDLTPLRNVVKIESGFLHGCKALSGVDLTPLANVTSIGDDFLSGCLSLKQVDCSSLQNVTSVGADFLMNSRGLTHVDLRGLGGVAEAGKHFLWSCPEISTCELPPPETAVAVAAAARNPSVNKVHQYPAQ